MKKNLYLALGLLVVFSMLLVGCGQKAAPTAPPPYVAQPTTPPEPTAVPPTPEPTAVPTAAPVKITIWHQWSGDYEVAIKQAFADYTAAHPNVTIDLTKPEDVTAALKVAIPAGEGPDIIAWANDQIGTNALIGNIVPLDDQGINMAFLNSTYEPAAVKGVVWQGKIWGLPESQEGIAFVYNKKLVTDEFLPTDPKDFNALLAKAKAFAEKNPGLYLVCNQALGNPDAYHAAPVYFGFGMPGYVDDLGNVYMGSAESIAAAKWMVEFSKYAPKETSHDLCKSMITEGKAGAWWTGPWAIADLEKAGVDYGILPMGSPFVGIKNVMLCKNAVDRGNAAVAIDVMKYYTSAEAQKKITLANKTIPANSAVLKDAEVQKLYTLAGFGASLNLGVPMGNTPFANAQWGPVGDATTAVWTGTQTPEEAMAAAKAAIEKAIADMK